MEFDEIEIIAIILDPEETTKLLRYLVKIGRAPTPPEPIVLNVCLFYGMYFAFLFMCNQENKTLINRIRTSPPVWIIKND